ncbi:MAG: 7-carboxy-7-deazaguanine synthase QueE [Candidatus Methanomethylophilaceae archaeon]
MRICEIFHSIQGEGLMMGVPTTFVRTVGCNLRCEWCDTQYSMDGGEEMSLDAIMERIGDVKHVCVTGGEPMLQPEMPELLRRLVFAGKQVVLETNGSVDLSDVPSDPLMLISMDIKCPSSGMTDRMLYSNLSLLSRKDQLKFIVRDDDDFDFALDVLKRYPVDTNIIFGPVGGTVKLEWLVDKVLKSGVDVRVLPQLHKIIWGDKRAV